MVLMNEIGSDMKHGIRILDAISRDSTVYELFVIRSLTSDDEARK